MNSIVVLYRKEWTELCRTKRLYALLGVYILFGMVSPILARYMKEIVSASMGSAAPILITTPVWSDSWKHFYSNLSQMGGISVLLIFMSSICGEKQAKTAELLFTKNLSPTELLTTKYLSAVVSVILAFFPAVLLCWGYTYYLFGYSGEWKNIMEGAFFYVIFMVVLLSIVVLASTLATTVAFAAMFAFGGYLVLILSTYLPVVGSLMPGSLLTMTMSAIINGCPNVILPQIVIALVVSILCICTSIYILKHQEI